MSVNCKSRVFSVQILELAKCSVLMRERSRVEETIHCMQRAGAGNLQVSVLSAVYTHKHTFVDAHMKSFDFLCEDCKLTTRVLQNQKAFTAKIIDFCTML